MTISIRNNTFASIATRNLTQHYSGVSDSVRKLSSGLRVNVAADDAAGLAIRELMRADIASHQQGLRNVNDAISMIQVADGALSVIDEKLIRMKELATQAATGTYNAEQRLIINDEFQAMKREIQRISEATDFNGIKVINDDVLKLDIDPQQINTSGFGSGAAESDIIEFNGNMYASDSQSRIYRYDGGTTWTRISSGPDNRLSPNGASTGFDIMDGKLLVHVSDFTSGGKIFQMNDDGSFTQLYQDGINGNINNTGAWTETFSGVNYVAARNDVEGASLYRNTGNGLEELVTGGLGDVNNRLLRATNHNGELYLGSINDNGAILKKYDSTNDTWLDLNLEGFNTNDHSVKFNEVDGKLYVSTRNAVEGCKVYELDEFGWKAITLNGFGNPNNREAKVFEVAGDTIINTRNDVTGSQIRRYEDGQIELLNDDGFGNPNNYYVMYSQTSDGEVIMSAFNPTDGAEIFKVGEVNRNGPLIHFGAGNDSAEDYYRITSGDAGISDSGLGIGNLNVASQTAAQYSLSYLDTAIIKKDKIRANLGATQNRLENTATNISIQAENLQAAESRISDVDVATEMTEFTRKQILTQAATAMLSQANSLPRTILQLIQG